MPIEENVAPPLGLRPKYIWLEDRRDEIMLAIKRYRDANKDVSMEWIDELVWIDFLIARERINDIL